MWFAFVVVGMTLPLWARLLVRVFFQPKIRPGMHWKNVPLIRHRRLGFRYNPAAMVRRLIQKDIEQRGLGAFMLHYGTRSDYNYNKYDEQFGELWKVNVRGDDDIKAVRVHDPYGEQKEYWLRVPPWMYSAQEALAWTFDMGGARYDPIVQT